MAIREKREAPFESLLRAIEENDPLKVKKIVGQHPHVISELSPVSTLYTIGLSHWLYVGDTALHLAAAGHRARIVDLLLTAGADPNASANHRRSAPLHYAADGYVIHPAWNPEQQVKTIVRLIDAGALINARDKNGATPLHRSVRTRCHLAVDSLLANGADPLCKNDSGSTPFHLAVQNTGRGGSGDNRAKDAQRAIIDRFLQLGISPDLQDAKGKSVRQSARSEWIREMFQ